MRSNRARDNKLTNGSRMTSAEMLEGLFLQARAQFGNAVKSFWFYEGELCPGCLAHPVGMIKVQGRDALALNAFIYRPRGVLIGYFLCENCVGFIFKEAQKNPYKETPLHAEIERNLTAAYHKHLASLDA